MADDRTAELTAVLPIMRQTAKVCCLAAQPKAVALALLIAGAETFGTEYGDENVAGWLRTLAATYEKTHPITRPDTATLQ